MFSFFRKKGAVIRHRPEHCVSRKLISREALKVLYRLSDAGYKAYLVGGGVRDILLGRAPKDFDVATDATPREIKRLFTRCFIIGRRFRLAHVIFGDVIIETSTFRKQPDAGSDVPDGELYQSDDNTFGTPEEDAKRRDFTVNGLFYDIKTFDVIDYVGGLRDLDKRILRSIGDPDTRFREDPVRMMRAIRLACKLGLDIERKTLRAIRRNYREIEKASTPRILEELFRMFPYSASSPSFRLTWETKLLSILMPHLSEFIDGHGGKRCKVWDCLAEFDRYTKKSDAEPSNGLRIAVIYLAQYLDTLAAEGAEQAHRGRRAEIADRVIRTMNEKYQLPRIALQHAVRLLVGLSDFAQKPQRGRAVKDRDGQFSDTLVVARIAARVFGNIPEGNVDAWANVKREVIDSRRGRRGGAHADSAPSGDAQNGAAPEAAASDTGAEDGAPRRRRHRRGSRGGRKHHGQGGAAPAQNDAPANQQIPSAL